MPVAARFHAWRFPCSLSTRGKLGGGIMLQRHLTSIDALTSTDDDRWINELKVAEVREEVAHARSLLDDSADRDEEVLGQELARLGCRLFELAKERRLRRSAP